MIKKRTETLRRLVRELPEREAAGHQSLISRELQKIDYASQPAKNAFAEAMRKYVLARQQGISQGEEGGMYQDLMDALKTLENDIEDTGH